MRVFTENAYGIPPEQVVGSTPGSHFEMRDGIPTIVKDPKIILIDDKDGKPVGIYRNIGRRPILAVGNSDGDNVSIFRYSFWRYSTNINSIYGFRWRTLTTEKWTRDKSDHTTTCAPLSMSHRQFTRQKK
jgi:hypothetical protein